MKASQTRKKMPTNDTDEEKQDDEIPDFKPDKKQKTATEKVVANPVSLKKKNIESRLPTYMYIWGESGTGKTIFAIQQLGPNGFLHDKFDQYVFVVPTFFSRSNVWYKFYEQMELTINENAVVIEDPREIKDFIQAAEDYEDIKDSKMPTNKKKALAEKGRFYNPAIWCDYAKEKGVCTPPPTIWIFDDFQGNIFKNSGSANNSLKNSYAALIRGYIDEMFINGRHRQISCLALTQDRGGLRPTARTNARHVVFFPTTIRDNLRWFADYFYVVKHKHDFIMILSEIGSAQPYDKPEGEQKENTKNYIHSHKDTNTIIVRINFKTLLLSPKKIQRNIDRYRKDFKRKYAWKEYCWLSPNEKKYFRLIK